MRKRRRRESWKHVECIRMNVGVRSLGTKEALSKTCFKKKQKGLMQRRQTRILVVSICTRSGFRPAVAQALYLKCSVGWGGLIKSLVSKGILEKSRP